MKKKTKKTAYDAAKKTLLNPTEIQQKLIQQKLLHLLNPTETITFPMVFNLYKLV